jgi:lysophospholipase
MLGHSMGGHIGLRYLAEREHPFAAAALVAPMFDIDFGMLPRPFASAISRMCMRLGLGQRYAPGQRDPAFLRCGFEGNRLTSCPERFAAWRQLLERHPEKVIGGVTFGWLDASLRSIQQTRRPGYLEAVDTPLLVCRAGQERIVCNRAVQEFVARLPRASLIDVEEARHDLFWERTDTRLRVIDRISGFFRDSARAAKQRSQAA